jgi:hypothetical protein
MSAATHAPVPVRARDAFQSRFSDSAHLQGSKSLKRDWNGAGRAARQNGVTA